jgi:hypothetical protein
MIRSGRNTTRNGLGIWTSYTSGPPYQDTDDDILNDVTDDKMRLWTWLDQDATPPKRHYLDPEAKEALGSVPPEVAWEQIHTLVFQAFEYQPGEAQKLMDEYQPPFRDQMSLDLALQHVDPVVGLNNFQYLNKKVDLRDVMKSKPLDVLEEVLRMITLSDKWQTDVLI